MNLKASADAVSVIMLDEHHRQSLERALMRVLHTGRAEDTYAEILDGMPTTKAYRECTYSWKGHPSVNHPELCPGIREQIRDFRANFDITTLQFSVLASLRPLSKYCY